MPERIRRILGVPGRALAQMARPLRPLGGAVRLVARQLRGTRGRGIRAVLVMALAAGGYFLYIFQTHVDRSLLSRLIIPRSALSPTVPTKAALAEAVSPSQSSFAATRQAAKRDPDATGMYAREWYVSSSGPPEVGIVLQLLPDVTAAKKVISAEIAELKTAPTLSGETPTAPRRFSVSGVPGAAGESYLLDDAATSTHVPVGSSYTVVYRVGDAVASELMVTTSPTRDTAAVNADARAGAVLLASREQGFSLVRHAWPLDSSLVYAAATVAAAAGVVFLPEFLAGRLRRRRERHHERELRRSREQYLARGRRTVRRQRAPAWSQPRRR